MLGGLYDVWRTTGDGETAASLEKEIGAHIEGLAGRVARWLIANLHVPYVRWSQAHMFAALGSLAATTQQ